MNTNFDELVKKFFNDENVSYVSTLLTNKGNSGLVNIIENDDDYIIDVSAPGITKDEIDIDLSDGYLTIKTDVNKDVKDDGVIRKEFYKSPFSRSFKLPKIIDTENISAKMENGILNIIIPKIKETKKGNTKINID